MNIKLIALDLDGTLLDGKKNLSKKNLEALTECIARGIHIVPATGRTLEGIPKEFKELPGVRYAITLNGGIVIDNETKRVIDERKLDYQKTLELLDIVSEYHVMYDVYIDGMGISEERFYNHLDEYGISPEIQKLVKATRRVKPSIKEYVRECGVPIEKINLYFDNLHDREELREILSRHNDVIITSSIENNLEINALGATKGEGLFRLTSYLNIGIDETMACGDGENDLTMIQTAGMGVAMANGEESLRAIADYVTASNEEDGVAQAIWRFALF